MSEAKPLADYTAVELCEELCRRGYNVKLTKPRQPKAETPGPRVDSIRMVRR